MVPRLTPDEYNLKAYGDMIADAVRMRAYHDALAASIKPGDTVLDLGAGPGIMALLACKLGAGHVYAIEPSDAIAVGMELARANGCADRIEFIQASSLEAKLRRKVDVMVSDLRGVLPLYGGHVPSLVDARRRLLAKGGIQIPQRDTVLLQLVDDAALHAEQLKAWTGGSFGLDLSAALRWAANTWSKANLSRSRLVGQPLQVLELDYRTIKAPNVRGEAEWLLDRASTVHGVGGWFDTVLAPDIGFSNAPGQPRTIYGQAFFPFPQPLEARAGDRVRVTLAANLVRMHYVWQWNTSVTDAEGRVRLTLRQSSFQGTPLNPGRLGRGKKKA